MNAGQIRDIAEARFSDTGNVIRGEVEWLDYINAAYRRFVQLVRPSSLVATASVTVTAQARSAPIPAAALQGGLVAVFDGSTPLDPQPADIPAKQVRWYTDAPSRPLWWKQEGSSISVLPAPAAPAALTLHYLAAPAALTAASTPAIPETFHDALVTGALALAYRDDDAIELAQAYEAEFAAIVASATGEDE